MGKCARKKPGVMWLKVCTMNYAVFAIVKLIQCNQRFWCDHRNHDKDRVKKTYDHFPRSSPFRIIVPRKPKWPENLWTFEVAVVYTDVTSCYSYGSFEKYSFKWLHQKYTMLSIRYNVCRIRQYCILYNTVYSLDSMVLCGITYAP